MEPAPIKLQSVSPADIRSDDLTFRITTRSDTRDLEPSIQRLGVMVPPILLQQKKDAGYLIVSGFRRIRACRRLGRRQVTVRLLPPDVEPRLAACLAVADNALQRPLNPVETSRALNLLAGALADDDELPQAAAEVGLPDNPVLIQKLRKISRLPEPVQQGILDGTLSLAMALELGRYPANEAVVLVDIFSRLGCGLNRQRELLGLMREIARREGLSLEQVLEEETVAGIVNDRELDRNRKTRVLQQALYRRRYPRIDRARREFERRCKALKLGPAMRLTPPPNFEAAAYTLSLKFSSVEELRQLRDRLDAVITHPALAEMLE